MIISACLALLTAVAIGLSSLYFTELPKIDACNLTIVSHRDFKRYYGLVNVENPLSHYNAEQGNSMNSKCQLFYDHMQILPSDKFLFSKSMIVQAPRGAGKTQIRQCILARLPETTHILIKIYGNNIDNYLDSFASNIDITPKSPYEKIDQYWTKEYFLQIILTEIASSFVNEKYFSIIRAKRDTIPLQTRTEMATLLGFYSTKHTSALCIMINLLLHELTECRIIACSIECDNHQLNNDDSETFILLRERHSKVKVKRQTTSTDAALKLLLAIRAKTKYSLLPSLDRSYRDQIASLISFLTRLNISTTVTVDSLDESKFFFDETGPKTRTLQTFVDSVTNDDVMYLALGNCGEGMTLANSLSFYILIPKISTEPLKISWTRKDKIPIIDLQWDVLQLINYADYIFDYLRAQSCGECQTLPTICSLLGGKQLCVDSIKQLQHPRDFHIFFGVLVQHLGTVCTDRNPPFIATQEDLKVVLDKIKSHVFDETRV